MSVRFGLVVVSCLIVGGVFACGPDDDDDGGNAGQGGTGGSFGVGGSGGTAGVSGGTGGAGQTGGTGGQTTGGTGGANGGGANGGGANGGGANGGGANGGGANGGGANGGSAGAVSGGGGAGAGGEAGSGGEGGAPGDCPLPDAGLLAVFEVEGQQFRVQLLDATAIDDALALYRGESQANIPNGRLVCEPAPYNCNYSWHLDPQDTHFAEITIEVCDGTPSYVEENCDTFGDRYCTWGAELIELYDCRESGCPSVE